MELQLQGKRALVTGSTSGIGETIAKTLAKEGVSVVIHGRKEDQAIRVKNDIIRAGGTASIAVGELTQDDSATTIAEQARDVFGSIDSLVNNAGGFPNESWFETSADV